MLSSAPHDHIVALVKEHLLWGSLMGFSLGPDLTPLENTENTGVDEWMRSWCIWMHELVQHEMASSVSKHKEHTRIG